MAAPSRIIAVALAVCLLVLLLLPVDGDSAKKQKPRFKIVERTYVSAPFISLPGIALASRYPDSVEVHGRGDAKLIDVDLILYEFSHASPKDLDILLVAPDGRSALVMADAGGASAVPGMDLTLDDDAKRALPEAGAIVARSYRPANYDDSVMGGRSAFPAKTACRANPASPATTLSLGLPASPARPARPAATLGKTATSSRRRRRLPARMSSSTRSAASTRRGSGSSSCARTARRRQPHRRLGPAHHDQAATLTGLPAPAGRFLRILDVRTRRMCHSE